jgi:hypothetical protein
VSRLNLFLTGVVSGSGLIVSGLYLLNRLMHPDDSVERALWAKLDLPELYERRKRRRALGMANMALISVMFFFGANFLNPRVYPPLALLFWILLLVLLIWLCLLALVDLADVRRLRMGIHDASRRILRDEMERVEPHGPSKGNGQR